MANDFLADGFVRLCIDPSLNYYDGKCRMLVEGQKLTAGTATADELIAVVAERDIEGLFGAGSVLGESLKKVFKQCGDRTQIFAIPRADPGSSVAAVYTITVAGDPTEDGRLELFMIDSDYAVDIFVSASDTVTQIASNIVAAIPADFPYAATSALGVVTLTAKNKGTVGNFLNAQFNWRKLQNYAPDGITVTVVQATPGTGDIAALDYAALLGDCCYSVFALLGAGVAYQNAWQIYLESLWSCDTPQCFGHGYTWNSGTLGQVLARGTNAGVFSRLAMCPGELIPPWLQVAAYAAASACYACDNPEISIQGRTYGVLSSLKQPALCSNCWNYDEEEQLREAGFVVTGPVTNGTGVYTSPYVYNDVTNYLYDDQGRANATYRDANSRRLVASTAEWLAEMLSQYTGLGLFSKNTQVPQGTFGTTPRMLLADVRAAAKEQVGVRFSEFEDMNSDITLFTDFEIAPKCQGVPGKLHLNFRYRPPVRISRIITNLQPKLLDNCVR